MIADQHVSHLGVSLLLISCTAEAEQLKAMVPVAAAAIQAVQAMEGGEAGESQNARSPLQAPQTPDVEPLEPHVRRSPRVKGIYREPIRELPSPPPPPPPPKPVAHKAHAASKGEPKVEQVAGKAPSGRASRSHLGPGNFLHHVMLAQFC